MADNSFYVSVDAAVGRKIPESHAAELIIVIPVEIELVDVCLTAFVFAYLRVVQVKSGNFTDHECLDICGIALAGYGVGSQRNFELAALIVETLHEYEDILIELHLLFAQTALHHLAVAFADFDLAATFAPVEKGDFEPDLDRKSVV